MKNSGARKATPTIGGIFLKQVVLDDIPYCPIGATGFGVRARMDYLGTSG